MTTATKSRPARKASASPKQDAYERITAAILESLDRGVAPWRKPWSVPAGGRLHNGASGHLYRGINTVILAMETMTRGYRDPRWVTFKQAQSAGGSVKRGEKGTPIVFWNILKKTETDAQTGEEKARAIPLLRLYTVFNVEQTEGCTFPAKHEPDAAPCNDWTPDERAEAILEGMPNRPALAYDGGSAAFYRPALDSVHLPARETFSDPSGFYATAFHELAHSTGHEKRLNRHGMETGIAPFGSPVYGREELAAEFGSAFLLGEAGYTEVSLEQTAAYIGNWRQAIKADPKAVVTAAAQGQKAADYILGHFEEEGDGHEE